MIEIHKNHPAGTDIDVHPCVHPAAQKTLTILEFILQLCRLVKSIVKKVFIWLEKWKYGNTKPDSVEPEPDQM